MIHGCLLAIHFLLKSCSVDGLAAVGSCIRVLRALDCCINDLLDCSHLSVFFRAILEVFTSFPKVDLARLTHLSLPASIGPSPSRFVHTILTPSQIFDIRLSPPLLSKLQCG